MQIAKVIISTNRKKLPKKHTLLEAIVRVPLVKGINRIKIQKLNPLICSLKIESSFKICRRGEAQVN